MKPAMMKYNPAFLKQDELIRSFVVRGVDLELTIETIKENSGSSNQHILLIGPRGTGKTMLALRTVAYINRDERLNSRWYSIVFSEESYEVFTAAEFWLWAVFHLAKQEKDDSMMKLHDELREEKDERRLYDRALACLMDFAHQRRKRLLLVVENLNMILDDQVGPDGSWDLRHTLLNESRIMLLGTAPTRFDEIENSGKAMFDLFRIHYLEPLDTRESEQLWQFLTGEAVGERRIRPIQILTGGNPRLIAILSSFAAGASFGQLMEQITRLIDEYTNYFKSNIESLPALERKIFVTLANIWEPATAAQVAGDARIAVNKTSSLLKRLELRGSVSAVKNTGGRKSYQVTERLYNIYHLMRLRGGQSGRVKAVVDFMVNFYEGEELAKKIAQMAKEACGIDKQNQSDYLEAYKEIFKTVENDHLREQILQLTEPQFLKLPGVLEALSPAIEDSHWIKEPHTAYGKKTTGELLRRRLNKAPRSFFYQHLLATVLAVQGKWDEALSIAAEFLKNPSSGEEFPNDIIGFFIKAASAGYAKEGLKILKNSSCTSSMEPLIVALQMATGETFNAPQEVVEVAGDVHKQIEEKRKDHN